MEIRKTNLGVEYELELSSLGHSSVNVIATFPNVESEWKDFEIKINNPHRLSNIHETEEESLLQDSELAEAQQYINEQAIMYVSMELAKLMGEGKIKCFWVSTIHYIGVTVDTNNNETRGGHGLPQIEELIKQIRYS